MHPNRTSKNWLSNACLEKNFLSSRITTALLTINSYSDGRDSALDGLVFIMQFSARTLVTANDSAFFVRTVLQELSIPRVKLEL